MQNTTAQEAPNDYEISLMELFNVLKRRKMVILAAILSALVLAGIFVILQKPQYTAQTTIQFDLRNQNVVDIDAILKPISNAESELSAEVDVITSTKLLTRVVKRLQLHKHEFFYDTPGTFSKIKKAIKQNIPFLKPKKSVNPAINNESLDILSAVGYLQGKLDIVRARNSYTIALTYTSESPKLSARILNTIVEEYLASHLNDKYEVTLKANAWLDEKVAVIKKKLLASEEKVQAFMEKNNIVSIEDRDSYNGKLANMNSQLIEAKGQYALFSSRLREVSEIIKNRKSLETLKEVQSSALINKLLIDKAEILRSRSELSEVYLSKHPKMVKVNAELADTNQSISDAIKNIITGIQNQVTSTKTIILTLQENIAAMRKQMQTVNRKQMQLAELVRERDADKTLYDSFLTRFKETTEDQGYEKKELRILAPATPPKNKSWPKYKIIFILAILMGGFLGTALVLVLEFFNNTVQSLQHIETLTHVDAIGIVPELKKKHNPNEYVVTNLTSVFTESLRQVNTAIHFSNPDSPPKSIMVTSSTPKEGKSVFALAYAKMLACSGKKVLLVDCDMRLPTVHKAFTDVKEQGLSDLLIDNVPYQDVLNVDKISGLHFIRSFPNTPHSQEILSSDKMKDFMTQVKDVYDYVIIDSPPIMAISDSIHLSKVVDTTVFMARWEKTSKSLLKNSIKLLESSNVKLSGVVLSRVDLKKYKKYNQADLGYCYGEYKDYYTD